MFIVTSYWSRDRLDGPDVSFKTWQPETRGKNPNERYFIDVLDGNVDVRANRTQGLLVLFFFKMLLYLAEKKLSSLFKFNAEKNVQKVKKKKQKKKNKQSR